MLKNRITLIESIIVQKIMKQSFKKKKNQNYSNVPLYVSINIDKMSINHNIINNRVLNDKLEHLQTKILEKTRIQNKWIFRQISMTSTFLNISSILKTLQNIYVIVVQNCVLNIRFVMHFNYTLNNSLIL